MGKLDELLSQEQIKIYEAGFDRLADKSGKYRVDTQRDFEKNPLNFARIVTKYMMLRFNADNLNVKTELSKLIGKSRDLSHGQKRKLQRYVLGEREEGGMYESLTKLLIDIKFTELYDKTINKRNE